MSPLSGSPVSCVRMRVKDSESRVSSLGAQGQDSFCSLTSNSRELGSGLQGDLQSQLSEEENICTALACSVPRTIPEFLCNRPDWALLAISVWCEELPAQRSHAGSSASETAARCLAFNPWHCRPCFEDTAAGSPCDGTGITMIENDRSRSLSTHSVGWRVQRTEGARVLPKRGAARCGRLQ